MDLFKFIPSELSDTVKYRLLFTCAATAIIPILWTALAKYLRGKVKKYVKETIGDLAMKETGEAKSAFDAKPPAIAVPAPPAAPVTSNKH